MRKAKNVFSVISIALVVLGFALLMLYPVLFNIEFLKPEGGLENPIENAAYFGLFIPASLFNFPEIFAGFQNFNVQEFIKFGNLFRLITLVVLLVLLVFFIIWLVMIIVKKRPKQLIWWFLLIVMIVAAVDALQVSFMTAFEDSLLDVIGFNGGNIVINQTLFFMMFQLATKNAEILIQSVNPILAWIELVAIVFVVIGLVLSIVSLALNMAWLKTEDVEDEYRQSTEEVVTEATPVASQAAPVVAETTSEEVATQPVEEPAPKIEEEEELNNCKVVRRILVHKSGKVIRVLNEHYYDVTTNIYVEPGFEEPFDPNETEKSHYEKLIASQQPVAQPEPKVVPQKGQFKKAEPVVAAPAPVVEEQAGADYERISFQQRMKKADKSLKALYNDLKNEILSYGVKSRVSANGDTFRLHTKTYVKMTVAGKSIKLYLALDPKDYKGSTIPFDDASKKNLYKEIPFVFKVKSDLSIRRAKQLIADTMAKGKLTQGKVEKHDWVKEL